MARTLVLAVMLLTLLLHARCSSPSKTSVVCSPQDLDALRAIRDKASPFTLYTYPSSLKTSWVGEDCCSWPAVECDSTTHRVNLLQLSGFGFGGTILERVCNLSMLQVLSLAVVAPFKALPGGVIPHCFGRLQHLTSLELMMQFSGAIPAFLSQLLNLTSLDLVGNKLSGAIPSSLSQLLHLTSLDLRDNELSGAIPASLSRLVHLQLLGLSFNQLSGAIPASLSQLQNLKYLYLSNNQLSGSIPLEWKNLTQLTELDLSHNQLAIGQPPAWLFTLPLLRSLSLGSCGISSLPCSLLQNMTILAVLHLPENNLTADALHCLARAPLQLQYLNLSSNPFNSVLPSHVTCLSDFYGQLYLRSCNLTGYISPSFLASKGMRALRYLDLSRNHLVGTVPSMLGNLSNLQYLDLSHNCFTGVLPSTLGHNMSNLQDVYLSNNGFTGMLPSTLGQCSYLYSLHLGDNHLEGEIPSELGKLGHLHVLALQDNNLSGTVPNLWNCTSLELLDLGHNNLHGTLEDLGLSRLPNLRVLVLGSNRMDGSIPDSLATFSQALQVIDLSQNSFSGGIPPNLNNLTAFVIPAGSNGHIALSGTLYEEVQLNTKGTPLDYPYILVTMVSVDLGANSLSGGIPSSLGDLSQMVFLNLSQNNLTGLIPPRLSNLSPVNLETLDLSNNFLHGPIPPGFSRLTGLNTFNVAYNQLSGPIPQGGQFNTFTNASYLGNQGLCGDIPIHKPCTPGPSIPTPPAPPEAKSTSLISMLDDWVSIPAVCVGYVVTFMVTVWFLNFSPFSYRARQ